MHYYDIITSCNNTAPVNLNRNMFGRTSDRCNLNYVQPYATYVFIIAFPKLHPLLFTASFYLLTVMNHTFE